MKNLFENTNHTFYSFNIIISMHFDKQGGIYGYFILNNFDEKKIYYQGLYKNLTISSLELTFIIDLNVQDESLSSLTAFHGRINQLDTSIINLEINWLAIYFNKHCKETSIFTQKGNMLLNNQLKHDDDFKFKSSPFNINYTEIPLSFN